jgi:hypothetical protein
MGKFGVNSYPPEDNDFMERMRRSLNFWVLTLIGSVNLIVVGLRFWRGGLDALDYIRLATITLCIPLIWFAYFQHSQGLVQLESQVEEKTLARLTRNADTMCLFGYLMLQSAMAVPIHH